MKLSKWFLGGLLVASLIALVATTQAFQPTPLAQIALQLSELPEGSQVLGQGAFAPDTPLAGGGYGMVNEKGEQWVQDYVQGYMVQALVPSAAGESTVLVANYVHRFASEKAAQAEYARWQTQLLEFKPVAAPTPLPSAPGFVGVQFVTIAGETHAPIQWGIGQKGDVLWLVMVEEMQVAEGLEAGQPTPQAAALFAMLMERLAQR